MDQELLKAHEKHMRDYLELFDSFKGLVTDKYDSVKNYNISLLFHGYVLGHVIIQERQPESVKHEIKLSGTSVE